MPYIEGRRVSNREWTERFGTHTLLHTGPSGDNPAEAPELDESTGAPKPRTRAGGRRSKRSVKAAKAAIADALGVKEGSQVLEEIDLSGLDADGAGDGEADEENE